ncbi:MAG TPA: IS21 family transposase [Verrucomicrobia bacterium]|nr:MAG: integrase [Lentisphaerae bacterium GWF2_57_35]HBA82686.1 IS21 family transposase [Verrucomicrobiota bacterium]
MIAYELYCRLRQLREKEHWSLSQIARELGLHRDTVRHWASAAYRRQKAGQRTSKLDEYKGAIVGWLNQHPFSARQLLPRLREQGYRGGYSILTEYVRQVRPKRPAAYLTLHFEPGECAQVDWGCAGSLAVGSTRRRLSFLAMTLCYSRKMYVEFTLAETLEQFLACQQNAFRYFGGAPRRLMIDNLKTAGLSHPAGQPATYHPRYLDFARFFGLEVRACNARAPHEKGRVERAVGYVKQNFLSGYAPTSLSEANLSVRRWLDEVAHVRVHAETKKTPEALFKEERLSPLPAAPYDVSVARLSHATRRCRVHLDGNRYSVPAEYAGTRLSVQVYPDKLLIYCRQRLVAEHVRTYDRGADLENPEHVKELLDHRKRAWEQNLLRAFFRLSSCAETYCRQMETRRLNPRQHARKIVALSEIYGVDEVDRALRDALEFEAFSSEYIANILEQRRRVLPEPGALHLTRRADLLDLDLPPADLDGYERKETP